MRIIQCIATRNGLFRNCTVPFSDGVTVIVGPNDSGKTYLASSILDMFSSFAGSKPLIPESDWSNTFLTVSFLYESAQYTLTRTGNTMYTLSKSDGGKERIIFAHQNDGKLTLRDSVSEFCAASDDPAASILCKMDIDIFLEASFLASPMEGSTSLNYEVLRRLFVNDKSRFYALSDTLRGIFADSSDVLQCGSMQEKIRSMENSLRHIDKELQLSELRNTRIEKLSAEKSEIRDKITALESKGENLSYCRSEALQIQKLIEKKSDLCAEIETVSLDVAHEKERIRSISVVRNTLTAIFPQFIKFTEIQKENLSKIQKAYRNIRDSREEIYILETEEKSKKKRTTAAIIAILIFFTAAAVSAAAIHNPWLSFKGRLILGACIAGTGIILALIQWIILQKRITSIPLETALLKKESLEKELYGILAENGITLDPSNTSDIYEFLLQYFEEYGFYSEQESDMREMEQTIKDNNFFEESEERLRQLHGDVERCVKEQESSLKNLNEHYQENTPGTDMSVLIKKIDADIKLLNAETEKEKELLDQMEEEISLTVPADDTSKDLTAQRHIIEKDLLALYKKSRISGYMISLLDEAIIKREQHLFRSLSSKTADLLHRLTSNQYVTQINEDAVYDFIVGRNTVSFNTQLSHMITLCSKFALSDFLSQEDIHIPLFIDAPSTYMDSQRIKNLIEIAGEYSRKRQIVILTHDRSLCEGAGAVIEL